MLALDLETDLASSGKEVFHGQVADWLYAPLLGGDCASNSSHSLGLKLSLHMHKCSVKFSSGTTSTLTCALLLLVVLADLRVECYLSKPDCMRCNLQ